jgi:O-antigen/teichoic acid export membrane protein
MIDQLEQYLHQKFSEGQPRSIRAKRNILALFLLRGTATGINFFLVPLTIDYLNATNYGLWVTLSSIISWVIWMDFGLGNGLRNQLAVALAKNDLPLARSCVSTTYVGVALASGAVFILFWIAQPLLLWSAILNAPSGMEGELFALAGVVLSFFCLRLVFGLIGTVLLADQRPALSSLIEVLTNLLTLIAVLLLRAHVPSSLFWLGTCAAAATVVVPLAASFLLFRGRYRALRPQWRAVNFQRMRELIRIGVQFFALQLFGLMIFAGSNLIITQLFGPAAVTPFSVAYKYFGLPLMAFTILLTPFWSAYTEAYHTGDIAWIRMTFRRLRQSFYILALVVLIMVLVADRVYTLWVGPEVQVPFALSALLGAYVLLAAWSTIYAYFINGTGFIRLQMITAGVMCVVLVPLAWFFGKGLEMQTAGVVLAMCIVHSSGAILWPIQTAKILRGRAAGIWAR